MSEPWAQVWLIDGATHTPEVRGLQEGERCRAYGNFQYQLLRFSVNLNQLYEIKSTIKNKPGVRLTHGSGL